MKMFEYLPLHVQLGAMAPPPRILYPKIHNQNSWNMLKNPGPRQTLKLNSPEKSPTFSGKNKHF